MIDQFSLRQDCASWPRRQHSVRSLRPDSRRPVRVRHWLEEIIVTAQRREENLQRRARSPPPCCTGDMLENKGVNDLVRPAVRGAGGHDLGLRLRQRLQHPRHRPQPGRHRRALRRRDLPRRRADARRIFPERAVLRHRRRSKSFAARRARSSARARRAAPCSSTRGIPTSTGSAAASRANVGNYEPAGVHGHREHPGRRHVRAYGSVTSTSSATISTSRSPATTAATRVKSTTTASGSVRLWQPSDKPARSAQGRLQRPRLRRQRHDRLRRGAARRRRAERGLRVHGRIPRAVLDVKYTSVGRRHVRVADGLPGPRHGQQPRRQRARTRSTTSSAARATSRSSRRSST